MKEQLIRLLNGPNWSIMVGEAAGCKNWVGIGGKDAISTATNICLGSIIPPTDIKLRKKTLFGNLLIVIGGLVELSWIKVEKTY